MTKLLIRILPLILIIAAGSSACRKRDGGSTETAAQKSIETARTSPVPERAKYPRFYEEHFENGGEIMSCTGSAPLPWNEKMLELLDKWFLGHIQHSTLGTPSSIGIQKSADESLMIHFTPVGSGDIRTIAAVWVRRSTQMVENVQVVSSIRRLRKDLASEEEAIGLLKRYAEDKEEFEKTVEWKEDRAPAAGE